MQFDIVLLQSMKLTDRVFIAIANSSPQLGFYLYSVIKIYNFKYHKTTIHFRYEML